MNSDRSVVPLESNPEVFTDFAHDLGLIDSYGFVDVYSLTDPDVLGFVPRPVKALILLFPISEVSESDKNTDTKKIAQATEDGNQPIWFKQTIKNACGLYGLLHSLANNIDLLKPDSKLKQFIGSNPSDNGQYANAATDDFVISLSLQHADKFQQGQTAAPSASEDVDLHFITFVERNGEIYELDGRRLSGANCLGSITDNNSDLVGNKIITDRVQWYIENADEKNRLNLSLLGLVQPWD
ncbi:hypothetical protein HG536_0B03890 [Torulaspora globosa]|uniref:Ubiquitin carboxyl-terminal hydrolase n=1 Tax=Torulaspora globosa TaxID=48254 RepID=A0A7G3ZDD9_9SACH|nr:uncharacterized protein HG536_0B03890 [Torulaspora globosa]QLL31525.1 hypothetical protein HG536_0B03890 [Torulaspora globosa]